MKILLEASDFFGNPIAFSLHADHVLKKNKTLELLKDGRFCKIKLRRKTEDFWCSYEWAKQTHDWGKRPELHKIDRSKTDWVCPEVPREYILNTDNWFAMGNGLYDLEVTFFEHINDPEGIAHKVAAVCGLKRLVSND